MDPRSTSSLRIHLFGHFRLSVDGTVCKLSKPGQTHRLLAYLLLRHGPVARDFLAFTLWPEDDEEVSLANLRRYLYLLQRSLPPPAHDAWILVDAESVQWNPAAAYWLDIAEFERLSIEGAYSEAVELYTNDLLEAFYDDWIVGHRERLRERCLTALGELVLRSRSRHDVREASRYARRILRMDPWREDMIRALMTLSYEAGSSAQALGEYQRFVGRLRTEMAADPMPETVALRDSIVRNAGVPSTVCRAETDDAPSDVRDVQPTMPFVGRRDEMNQFRDRWKRALEGDGRLMFVAGEPGIGKTRLASEAALIVESNGGRVLWGATTSPERGAYQALTEALRTSLALLSALNVKPIWLSVLASLVPELQAKRPDLVPPPSVDPNREQLRLLEAMATCLVALARARPLLLVLEDLHWAGSTTIEALRFLVPRLSAARILIVVTYRDDETSRVHPLRVLRRELEGTGVADHLLLRGLDAESIRELAATIPDLRARAGELSGTLLERSGGSPLFLREALSDLLDSDGGSRTDADRLPLGIRRLVARRLARLSAGSRSVAEAAAAVGESFNVEVLREVMGWSEDDIFEAIGELLDHRFVREGSRRANFDYTFTHHAIRSAIYDEAPPAARARRHHRIATVLESTFPERAAEMALDLAGHYDRAGRPAEAGARYAVAARRSFSLYANDESLSAIMRALELIDDDRLRFDLLGLREAVEGRRGERHAQERTLETMGTIAEEIAGNLRDIGDRQCEVLWRRVLLYRALGRSEDENRCIAELTLRADVAGLHSWVARAAAARAVQAVRCSVPDRAREVALEALKLAQGVSDGPLALECLCTLAEIDALRGEFAQTREWLRLARSGAEAQNNKSLIGRTMLTASKAALLSQDFAASAELATTALDLYRTVGDREGEADALARIAVTVARRLRVEEARLLYAEAAAIYESIGKRLGLAAVLINAGVLELWVGRLDAALQAQHAARLHFDALGDVRGKTISAANCSMALLLKGEPIGAHAAASDALDLARVASDRALEAIALANLGAAERDLGDFSGAIMHMEAAIALRTEADRPADVQADLADLALTYLRAGQPDKAVPLADQLAVKADDIAWWPWHSYWAAAQVYRATGHSGAVPSLLAQAHSMLQERAANVPPDSRDNFFALSINRELIAAFERDEWPSAGPPVEKS